MEIYGIRYRNGIFNQSFKDGYQVEKPETWLKYGDVWSVMRPADEVIVSFVDGSVRAVPYDMPIIGYGTININTLRLWEAKSLVDLDLGKFNQQDYLHATQDKTRAEDISRVLYPNDSTDEGKKLRLKQQYFFVSASLQDILRKYKRIHGTNFDEFPSYVAIQLNDTHPVIAIPELMRLFVDLEGLSWEKAWSIVEKTFSYTNHTILAEALEKWWVGLYEQVVPRVYQITQGINNQLRGFLAERFPNDPAHTILAEALEKWWVGLYEQVVPRVYQITQGINNQLRGFLAERFPNDPARQDRMSIIQGNMIHMAWLAIYGTHATNGVAALHTEILKHKELKDWYELYPERFLNKTNGITQRRWLLQSNPELSALITELIGNEWITDLSQLKKLEAYVDDEEVLKKLLSIKHAKKIELVKYLREVQGIEVNPNSIFDIQIKRLHEYKRQLLNIFHVIGLYNKLKLNPSMSFQPVTYIYGAKAAPIQIKRLHEYKRQLLNIFHVIGLYNKLKLNPSMSFQPVTYIYGAKAAPGYLVAKGIIRLINEVAQVINKDPETNGKLRIVFVENYRVSVAQKLFPAADISEQISTAGKEASGTGNMKFMLNGALTIGTLDGANVEIVEEAGEENNFIFGLKVNEIEEMRAKGYDPHVPYNSVEGLKKIVDSLIDGTFNDLGTGIYGTIHRSLMENAPWHQADQYFVLEVEGLKKIVDSLIDGTFNDLGTGIYGTIHRSLMENAPWHQADQYFVLEDFEAYRNAQKRINVDYRDRLGWAKKQLMNIANAGKFSSDRTIKEYADEIWFIEPAKLED